MIQHLKNGRWRVRIEAGRDIDGRRIQKQRTFKTKAEAVRWERQMQLRSGVVSSYRLDEFFDELYFPFIKERTRPATHLRYKADYDRLIRPTIGRNYLENVTPYMVQGLIDKQASFGAKRNAYVLLRQMFRKALAWRMVSSVPTDGCELPKHRRKPIEVIPAGMMGEYLEAVEKYDPELLPAVCVSMMGARRSEVCALDWSDVSLSDPVTVHIHRSLVAFAGESVVSDTKTEHSARTLVMPEVLARILRDTAGEGPLIDLHPDTYSKRWLKAIAAARLPRVTLKNVRHSVGTALVESGMPLHVVQDLLGHDLETTTSRYYVQQTEGSFVASAQAMDGLLGSQKLT